MTALIFITIGKPIHCLGNEKRTCLRDKDKLKSNSLASFNDQSRRIHLFNIKIPLSSVPILMSLDPCDDSW